MELDEQMANQADSHGIIAATTVADAPAPQNGAAADSIATSVVADGSVTAVEKAPPPHIDKDLTSPDLFLNRELTWLAFNRRVLHEAEDERNPLLERLKFLAITASNLDEFFMKRIGGLKQQVVAGMHELTVDGRAPQQQINECYLVVREIEQRQREVGPHILRELENHGIRVRLYASLSDEECKSVRDYYYKNIFPLVTPQAMDPAHPFPFVSNLSLNLLVTARYQNDSDPLMARVKVPVGFGIPRFLRVGNKNDFVRLEDVISNNLDLLFPSMLIDSYELFRVTRNANTERDEDEADDLLALIESELRDRRFAPIVRLEVLTGMNPVHRGMLAAELGLDERSDVFEVDGMLSMRDLAELAAIDEPALHDPPHHPVDHPRLTVGRSIFHVIRDAGSFLLLHPYESFSTSVERFLREAADDPKVRAIKMTLYRTSPDSKIIGYLCDAARNGKQVAVVVELKARFDEAANIQFATKLEEFGIHVTYGVVGLKTHSKVILVIRQDYNGLRRYAHIGTGNYHPVTARFYADYGLLTCDGTIGEDLTELFNYLTTGYMPNRPYRKILPAPTVLKRALLSRIEREIKVQLGRIAGADSVQDERARGRGYHAGSVSRVAGGGEGRPDRARHVQAASGNPGAVGERARREHRRQISRARARLLFSQRRRGGVFHRIRRLHEAQSREPGRSRRASRGSATAQGIARRARYPAAAKSMPVGDAVRRHLRQDRSRGRRAGMPAGDDRFRRDASDRSDQGQASAIQRLRAARGTRKKRRINLTTNPRLKASGSH